MNKVIITAGLLLLSASAQADGNYPNTGKHLPPAPPATTPQKPIYWTSYFDEIYDDSIDVTAAANARNTDELSRSGWERHHKRTNKQGK